MSQISKQLAILVEEGIHRMQNYGMKLKHSDTILYNLLNSEHINY